MKPNNNVIIPGAFPLNLAKLFGVIYAASSLCGSGLVAQTVASDPILEAQLRNNDEILLKAVHTADRAAWESFAAPDFFYLGEDGGVTYLNEFLKQLKPMSTPPLVIQTYRLTRAGDTAIVLHEDTDRENVRYVFTETWQLLAGEWRLRVLHITNVLSDPPAISLSEAQIDELAGTYRRESTLYVFRRVGNKVFAKRADDPAVEMKPETRDMLFTPGGDPRKRIVFKRDETGKIIGFFVRYESSDVFWTRVK